MTAHVSIIIVIIIIIMLIWVCNFVMHRPNQLRHTWWFIHDLHD